MALRTSCFILSMLCVSLTASAQQGFSLKEAQDYAVENSYQTRLALKEIGVSEQTVKNFLSIGYPQIDASGTFNHNINIPISVASADAFVNEDLIDWMARTAQVTGEYPDPPDPNASEFTEFQFGTKYTMNAGVSLNQLIIDGSFFVGVKAVRTYVDLSRLGHEKSELEVRNAVAQAYHTVVVAEENSIILEENRKALEKILADTKAMLEAGFVEEMDVDQVQLSLSNIINSVTNAQQQARLSRSLLKFQMGYDMKQEIGLKDGLEALMKENDESILVKEFNVTGHIDYRFALKNETLMGVNVRVEKNKYWPKLFGFFNHRYNAFRDEFSFLGSGKWYPTTMWGLNVQVRIFGGFSQKANVSKAKLELEKATLQKEQAEQGLVLSLETARLEYRTAMDLYNNQKEALALSARIRDRTVIKFQEGVAKSMEVSQVHTQYLENQGGYINAVFLVLNAKAKLDKVLNE